MSYVNEELNEIDEIAQPITDIKSIRMLLWIAVVVNVVKVQSQNEVIKISQK